ncbi:TonB-dependent receptor [Aquimarina megaterium]|uniref:TonB-dependent receptor n=1 Tax=Aquimarina megaterium TaxID=1443666 RepID=UPI0004717CFC|nr:TonB-dependent receptor [Aquimarina megaterium]
MKKITFLFVVILMAVVGETFAQGVTKSSINGKITDNTGQALPGANVVAIHTPSGTKYGAITDFDGFYRIANMRTGGPYKVTISYVGFKDYVKDNTFLQLGDSQNISTQMIEEASALEQVIITVTNNSVFDSGKTGTETTVTERQINSLPSVSRSVADFVRITPQAQITEGDDGFSVSLAGQNNRYNALYIDGGVSNDVFGLAGSGTDGGQTGVNPFSIDAIETFQINIAPFDVRQSGFSGGAINAITRSGTNTIEGSAYTYFRNESLAGKTPPSLVGTGESREKLSDFSAKIYGARIGGPIIKDKLFYFVNYEREEQETPQPFNFSNYQGNATLADIQNLSNFLQTTYGYNPGGFDNNTRTLDSDKLTVKLDWNINDNHQLSLKHNFVKAENLEARNSGNRNIGFINGSELFESTKNETTLEFSSSIGSWASNNLLIGYKSVRDDRDPSGNPFPTVDIRDGGGTISFGAEPFSTANLLDQDIVNIADNFEIYSGKHTVTIGTQHEFSKIKNLFFAFNYGDYTFNSLSDFFNGIIDEYQKGYSLVGGNAVGDESSGASEFKLYQPSFYVQDEISVTDNFKLTAGLRVDVPIFDAGAENPDFNDRTIPLLEAAGKDLQGARVGKKIRPSAHLSPRVGFNWDVKNDKTTQIRGGFGIFTSRIPLVWPGGSYNNNGITGGFTGGFNLDPSTITFNPNVNQQPVAVAPGTGETAGNIDIFTPDLKLPQVMKYNIAIDQKLPLWGLIASADFLYTDVITNIYYQNLNIRGPEGTLNGADNRPYYSDSFGDRIDNTYGRIILGTNTGEGFSYNTSFTLRKPFDNGFQGSVSYSYGESESVFDGTSSQNSSQWRNIQTVNGKNSNIPRSRSDFSQGSRFSANVSYEKEYLGFMKSTIALFYEGTQGAPHSFVYREGRDLLNDDSRDNALIYIPSNASEINLVPFRDRDGNIIPGSATPAEQWASLDAFIEGNDYLRKRRGGYAERNGDRGPWSHAIDLKFLQDFYINTGDKKNTLQLSLDIFNFTNLLNKDWGKRKFIPGNVALIETVRGGTADPEFTFDASSFEDGIEQIDDNGLQSSRWQMQVGLRYIFN